MISLTRAVFSWLPAHARSGEQGSTPCLCAWIQASGNTPTAPGQLIPQKYHCACFRGDKRHDFCCQGLNNNKKATAVITSGCVKVTPKQVLLLLTPTAHAPSLGTHRAPARTVFLPPSPSLCQTQEKSLLVRIGLFILISAPSGNGVTQWLTGVPGPCPYSWGWPCLTQSRIPLPPKCAHLRIKILVRGC